MGGVEGLEGVEMGGWVLCEGRGIGVHVRGGGLGLTVEMGESCVGKAEVLFVCERGGDGVWKVKGWEEDGGC